MYSDLVVTRNSKGQLLLLGAGLVIHHLSALLLAEAGNTVQWTAQVMT